MAERPSRGVTLALGAVAVAIGACGAADASPPSTMLETVETPVTTTTTTIPVVAVTEPWTPLPIEVPIDTVPAWTAAKAEGPLEVFTAPGAAEPFRVLEPQTILGTPTVVHVLGGGDAWLEVLLPGRPNGQTGWVRGMDVERFDGAREVVIDLSDRLLTVLDDGTAIFETSVGVGSPSSPTPTGSFFVTDAVRITNPSGPWGPYAFGLSARSDTVTEFNGGDGIIGIHGTNRPGSIGEAQSLGCVRVPNDVMLTVAELLSVGSPVTIRA